jgi:chemotaxis protein CheD
MQLGARATRPQAELFVSMAQIVTTNDPRARLTSEGLGSALATIVYDPEARVGGMLIFMLPQWEIHRKMALDNPALFANSGIPQLFRQCYQLGADKARMKCWLVGGADPMDGAEIYRPGRDNALAAVEVLARNGVRIDGQWVGGRRRRVARLSVGDGRLEVEPHQDEEA